MRRVRPARVLLVDDDYDFLLIWRLLLANDGRFGQIDEATSGGDALAQLQVDDAFDMVVSDVRMGAISGFDVLAGAQARHPHAPVVLTSSAEGVGAEAMSRGASLFLPKSQTTNEYFAETIWRLLGADAATGAPEARPFPPGRTTRREGHLGLAGAAQRQMVAAPRAMSS